MSGIIVIADDITGAAEIAGVCLRYGLSVSFDINFLPEKKTDVRVIVTDSRSMDEESAYHLHRKLAEEIEKEHSADFIFKKCDSVLRGYVLTELSALSEVFRKTIFLLQPANPSTGRCIRNGMYYINNDIIENTGFSTDPDFPANTSLIQNLLQYRSALKHHFTDIHSGKIGKIKEGGIFVPDCESVDDLYHSATLYDTSMIACGSAAFFEQTLIHFGYSKATQHSQISLLRDNFLIIAGSTHPDSIIFRQKMAQNGCPVMAMPANLLQEEYLSTDFDTFIQEIRNVFLSSTKLLLNISDDKIDIHLSSKQLKQRFSNIIKNVLANIDVSEIFIEGGATAFDIFQTMRLKQFAPVTELAPGVLKLRSEEMSQTHFTLKPGSYAWPGGLFMQSK